MEIERKFLVKNMPDLSSIKPIQFERYYLSISDTIEERIQRTNNRYSYERKTNVDSLSRTTEKREITKEEFEKLKNKASKAISRDSYAIARNISIKIYHGEYEGLARAEVEFSSSNEAASYMPEAWMGQEITDTMLGRDSRLLTLDRAMFKKILDKFK